LTKRGQQPREERRRAQVEVNLLAETDGGKGGRVISKSRSGCALPFLGGVGVLFLIAFEAVRLGLG
jgi:hypothetical protein